VATLDLDARLRSAAALAAREGRAVNPFATLEIVRNHREFDFGIGAPVPGLGLRRTRVGIDHPLHSWLFRLLIPGELPEPDAQETSALESAGVVVGSGQVPRPVSYVDPENARADAWESEVAKATALAEARAEVGERGYATLRSLLPEPWLGAVQRYYHELTAQGFLAVSDNQSDRYAAHNEPVAQRWHERLLPIVQQAVPEPIAPSYSYLGFYREGAALARHTDREQCKYTVSVTIDARPSPARADAWPLCLELPDGMVARALLAPGDALLFRGCEIPHFRERLARGRTSWSVFFHFVPAAFTGSRV
jgi:hypothetical protein